MISGQFYSNETDCHFFYDGGQTAGLAGAIRAKWCFVYPMDKTAAGVRLDPRHRGTPPCARQQATHPLQLLGARSAGLRRCGDIPVTQQFRRLRVSHLTH